MLKCSICGKEVHQKDRFDILPYEYFYSEYGNSMILK